MPLTSNEAIVLGAELVDLIRFLDRALKDEDGGNVKLDPDEAKELLRRLTKLAAKIALDVID
jgi:hypothetical protein